MKYAVYFVREREKVEVYGNTITALAEVTTDSSHALPKQYEYACKIKHLRKSYVRLFLFSISIIYELIKEHCEYESDYRAEKRADNAYSRKIEVV